MGPLLGIVPICVHFLEIHGSFARQTTGARLQVILWISELREVGCIIDWGKGFMPEYWYWTSHGEYEPHFDSRCGPSTSANIDDQGNI
ncbi:hypothetical protein M5K25_013443 [Dendrobium thyrsiflorum]|uniref:Uncharacterized protein n=1 Tax=Dendrobium thyrsiflorum TaxID=117978 RepID=A0ABD0UT72_DENTH